jgi:hypothetical protein
MANMATMYLLLDIPPPTVVRLYLDEVAEIMA